MIALDRTRLTGRLFLYLHGAGAGHAGAVRTGIRGPRL